jgi:hypothetical protein
MKIWRHVATAIVIWAVGATVLAIIWAAVQVVRHLTGGS